MYGHKELHGKPAGVNDNDDEYMNFILTRSEEINAKNKRTFFAFTVKPVLSGHPRGML